MAAGGGAAVGGAGESPPSPEQPAANIVSASVVTCGFMRSPIRKRCRLSIIRERGPVLDANVVEAAKRRGDTQHCLCCGRVKLIAGDGSPALVHLRLERRVVADVADVAGLVEVAAGLEEGLLVVLLGGVGGLQRDPAHLQHGLVPIGLGDAAAGDEQDVADLGEGAGAAFGFLPFLVILG